MGSFNEVCALSSLNIGYGTPVRLLFLTQNPYINSDQHEAQRGCYPTDQWFVRTPPIKGIYDDYGKCKFKDGPITKLICEVFQKDVIERPFGFNQYHAGDVTKTKGIHHFLHAAGQGRLLVQDYAEPCQEPPHFPTWQKIQDIIKSNNFPIQSESKADEGCAGYNAQPITPGVVCVTFNSYDDNTNRLKKVQPILEKDYDCRLMNNFDEACLMVAPKGSYDNPTILCNQERIKDILNNHPKLRVAQDRQLPVLAVMVREDVWQAYCTVASEPSPFDRPSTVKAFYDAIKKICDNYAEESKKEFFLPSELGFMDILFSLPFMITPTCHILTALEKGKVFDYLLQACAELARVEYVMGSLHQSWHIPSLGGQEGEWALRTKLLAEITAISQKELEGEGNEEEN